MGFDVREVDGEDRVAALAETALVAPQLPALLGRAATW